MKCLNNKHMLIIKQWNGIKMWKLKKKKKWIVTNWKRKYLENLY